MISVWILSFVIFLHSQGCCGVDPTFEELQSQLPIQLNPNGRDQYFFFIVPVQKTDDPNVILQMAQAQSTSDTTNGSIASTIIDTHSRTVNSSTQREDSDLNGIFDSSENETAEFNFQVPVIVPLDFRFTYDPATSNVDLPQCSVDTRTWKEKVISNIAEKLELPGEQSWDHSDLNIRIRLIKDALTSIAQNTIDTADKLSLYVSTIQQAKILADIRYATILSGVTQLTSGHISLVAEAVDTYKMLFSVTVFAEQAVIQFKADDPNDVIVLAEEIRINGMKPGIVSNLESFLYAFNVVKQLENDEETEESS